MSQIYYCSEHGCTRQALALTIYCSEHTRRSSATNLIAVLKPALQVMLPGDCFTMDFYGRIHRFAFEAWEGHNVVARPSAQPWALVRIPLTDLVTFNAMVTKQDF